MVRALVLLLSSVSLASAADLEHDLQMSRLLQINGDLEARVTALETQMTALQSMMTAQQSEVVAVQKEVAAVDTHLVQVDDSLTNLTGRYNDTVGLVDIMESSITTTITRLNQTEVRVSLVEETAKNHTNSLLVLAMGLSGTNKRLAATAGLANETAIGLEKVNGTLGRVATRLDTVNTTAETNTEGLADMVKVLGATRNQLAFTAGLANETALGLDLVNGTVGHVKHLVEMHGKMIVTANEAIRNIDTKELPDVKESVAENHEMVKKNEEKLGSHENSIKKNEKELEEDASLISDNKVAIVDNSKDIDHAERNINNLGKALNVVTRKVKANRKAASINEESIKEINKEMTYVKTQVVEFCGYQSSWGEEDKSVTYEYLTVSKNTASSGSSSVEYGEENLPIPTFGEEQQHPPTPRPTHRPHHKLPGLNKKTGLFVAPMAGTYRVSFQVGHLETADTNGEHKTSIFVRKNGLKDESLHMETKSHSEETNVIAHEALVTMSKEDTLDVFVDETKDDLYGILFCIALV